MIRFVGSLVISLFLIAMPIVMIISIIDHWYPFIETIIIFIVIMEVIALTSLMYYKDGPGKE